MNKHIDEALIDKMAVLEVQALLEGLEDEECKKNPAFLDKVRKFLKDNDLQTVPETPGVRELMKTQDTTTIPIFREEIENAVDKRAN